MSRSVQSVLASLQGVASVVATAPKISVIDELRRVTNANPGRNSGPGIRSTAKAAALQAARRQEEAQEAQEAPVVPVAAEGSDSRIVLRDINTGEFAPVEDAGKANVTTDFVDLPKLSTPSLKAEKAKKSSAKKLPAKKLATNKTASKTAAQKKPAKKLATNKQGSKIGSAKKKAK